MTSHDLALELWAENSPQEFLYDHGAREFLVDSKSVPISELLPLIDHWAESALSAAEHLEGSAFVLDCERLVQLPGMYEWLQKGRRDPEFAETRTVMSEVYNQLTGADLGQEDEVAGLSFGVEWVRPGHPILTVPGNCVCLYIDPDLFPFDQSNWEDGFATYNFHNIENEAQMTTLLAGIGHLGSLALED